MLRKTIIIRQEYIKPQLVFEEIEYEGKVMNVSGSEQDPETSDENENVGLSKEATFIFDDEVDAQVGDVEF